MQLVYHHVGAPKGVSPFDEALRELAAGAPLLRLGSPYIGLGFLNRLLSVAGDWRLLTDIEAWLQSGNRKHRSVSWAFITENMPHIRHVAGIHAKVAIGNGRLFLGSANFTERGVLGRAELSLLIDDTALVAEATSWFDELWATASPPVIEEGDALVEAMDSAAWTRPHIRLKLTSTAPVIAAVLAETVRPAGFDLAGAMAEAGIVESRELFALEVAYQRISDEWRQQERTFTFRELLQAVNQVSKGAARDVWPLITKETANHWLGGLDPDGHDRYVYLTGRFRACLFPSYAAEARYLDTVLSFVMGVVPLLPAHVCLPLESAWRAAGICETHILPTIELLLKTGLLVEHDIPGELERYSIDPDFDWPHRWWKFKAARELLERKVREHTLRPASDKPDDRQMQWLSYGSGSETYGTSSKKVLHPQDERHVAQDKMLAKLFEMLAGEPKPHQLTRESIVDMLYAAGLPWPIYQNMSSNNGFVRKERGELVFNPGWPANRHLRNYPIALEAWRKLTQA